MTLHLSTEDKAFVDCLRQMAAVYGADEMITQDRREALATLIHTYTFEPDSDFAKALGNMASDGLSVEDIREKLALDAGITDLGQLRFFAEIDMKLTNRELRTTSLRGLCEEQILALVQHYPI